MSKKLSVDELLRLACIYAERNQEAFLDSMKNMPDDKYYKQAEDFVDQIRKYRTKRWGRTILENIMLKCVPVSIADLAKGIDTEGKFPT